MTDRFREAHHPAQVAVRVVALLTVLLTIVYVGIQDGHFASVALAALFGFGLGLMLDRWVLRPVVDLTHHDRAA